MPDQNPELETTELIGLVEGTVDELKDYIREHEFSNEQLEQVLEAETASNDRKTAKRFLRRRIDGKKVKQESSSQKEVHTRLDADKTEVDREALLQMLGGTVEDVKKYVNKNDPCDVELQNLLHAEKMVKDRKTVVKFLKSYSKKKELEEDFHRAETDLNKLKQDLKKIEENVLEEDVALDLSDVPEPDAENEEDSEETGSKEQDESTDDDSDKEDTESDEEGEEESEDDEETDEEVEEEGEEDSENEDDEELDSEESDESEEDELSEIEKKKQILEDLEMNLSDEELEQITIEELEKLRGEKEKREQLIDTLSVKFDQEQLEQVTTKDLEKLAGELEGSNEISKQEAQRQEEEAKRQKKKDEEKLKKEAQEDLEMMMGAVKSEDDEDEDSEPGAIDQLKQLPDKLKGALNRGEDEEEDGRTGFDESKVIEVLEEYKQAQGREAAIKTAQVMKGYLEYALGVNREMTYAELADEMESRELGSENIDTLVEFYRSMKISVYTGDVEAENIDEVIDSSKSAVKELG